MLCSMDDGMSMLNALSTGVRRQLVRAAAHCGGAAVCPPNPMASWVKPELNPAHPQRSLFRNIHPHTGAHPA